MIKNPNYVYGPRDMKVPASVNFSDFLLEKFSQYKEKVCFINAQTDETLTYGQLIQDSIDVGVSLSQLGIKNGETIGLCSENRNEFFPSALGVTFTGAVLSPISASYTKDEMKHILSICKPRYMICSPQAYELHSKTWKSLPYIKNYIVFGEKRADAIWYGDLINKNIKQESFMPADVRVGQTETAFILYSSGTTGLPKGVEITHMNAIASCIPKVITTSIEDVRILSISPWFHAMGFWGTLGSLSKGRTTINLPKFTEKGYLEAIHKYKPNALIAPPPVLVFLSKTQLLSKYDVSSLIFMYSGAAPLDLETINDVKKSIQWSESIGTHIILKPHDVPPRHAMIEGPGAHIILLDMKPASLGPSLYSDLIPRPESSYFNVDKMDSGFYIAFAVFDRFKNLFAVVQGYGMTETTLAISRDTDESPKGVKPKSVGVVAPGVIVKIVDIETEKVVGPYQRGEIRAKGAVVMKGYIGMKNSDFFDEEGFYKTGDIGYFDEDQYLYIVDRLKELIKYKGYQVPPAELEAILLQHEAVRDAAVIGKPDKTAGELPMAFVVRQPGETVSDKEIMEFVASKVSSQKKLRGGVRFVNEIPKNPSGKILRKVLRQALKDGTSKL